MDGQLCKCLGNIDGSRPRFGNSVVGKFRQLRMGNYANAWATLMVYDPFSAIPSLKGSGGYGWATLAAFGQLWCP